MSDARWSWLLAAGLTCGLAACIRPILIPLPICLSFFIIAKHGHRAIRDAAGLAGTGVLPPLLLAAMFLSATHQLSLGNTMSGMGYNLYLRGMRTSQMLSPAEQRDVAQRYYSGNINERCIGHPVLPDGSSCSLSLPEFFSFAVRYPVANGRFLLRDLLTFVGKSGISSLTANYLDISSNDEKIKDYKEGWHAIWDSQGLYAAARWVFETSPGTALIEVFGSMLFFGLFILSLVGCREIWSVARVSAWPRPRRIAMAILIFLPIYVFLTSEVSADMLSRYRYPSEFAICILATLGGASVIRDAKRRLRVAL